MKLWLSMKTKRNTLLKHQILNKEIESFLQGVGGNYHPDFGYEQMLNFNDDNKWAPILDYV